MKIYALIEDGEVIDFQERNDISAEEWREGDWRKVEDNSDGVDRDKYSVSSDFELEIKRSKVIKTHNIVPLNSKAKRLNSRL